MHACTHLPPLPPSGSQLLLSAASPHFAPLCSLGVCAQNTGDSLGSGLPLWDEDHARANPHPLTRDAHSRLPSVPLTCAPTTQAALVSSRPVPPPSSSMGMERAHPRRARLHSRSSPRPSVPQAVAAMCDDTPNAPPRREEKKRTLGQHKRERIGRSPHRGMSNRWTSACSSKNGILRALSGEGR